MKIIYQNILTSRAKDEKLLAVLLDPDKFDLSYAKKFTGKVNESIATHIFVGGSEVAINATEKVVREIKKHTSLPIVLFPGDVTQITSYADAILFLSLISGDNPEYLIGKHVKAVSKLNTTNLEVISTGYILIENGKESAVQRVTKTKPLSRNSVSHIVDTALAGNYLGMNLIYLEAGSGAVHPISAEIIKKVKQKLSIPLIVGGGIRNIEQLHDTYKAGADLVVIGTAFEEDETFFDELKK